MKKFLGILLCAALMLPSAGVMAHADAGGVETFRDDVPSWVGNHIAFDTAKIYLTHEAYSGDAAMLVDVPTYGSIASPTNTGIPLNDSAAYEYLRAGDQYKLVMYKMPLEQKEDGTYDMGHNSIRIYNEFTTIDNPVIIDPDTNESVSGNFERKWYRLEYDFQMNSNMLATSEKLSLLPNVDCIYDNITLYQQVGDEYREVPDQYGIRNGDFEIGVFEPDESNIDTTVSYDAGDIGESMYITNGSPSVHFIQQVYYADASDSQALKVMVKDGYEEIWCATADSLDKNINTMQIRYKVTESYSESGNESIYLIADGENASKKVVPNTYETSKDGWEEFTAVWDGPVTFPKVYVQDHITVYFDEISFGTTVDGVYNKAAVNRFANNWNTNKNTPNPVTGLTADISEDDNSVTLSFNLPAENPVTLYGTKVYQRLLIRRVTKE